MFARHMKEVNHGKLWPIVMQESVTNCNSVNFLHLLVSCFFPRFYQVAVFILYLLFPPFVCVILLIFIVAFSVQFEMCSPNCKVHYK